MKILIVDDSATIRMKLKKSLEPICSEFIIATDGLEGLALLKTHQEDIAVVILDEEMPGLTGSQLCIVIRNELGLKHLPIISLTSLNSKEAVSAIFRAGASDYVHKPFVDEELIARIHVHYERYNMHRHMEALVETRTEELSKALQAAHTASDAKSKFVANMSHEMRTPLNSIIGFADLLLDLEQTEEATEYLNLVHLSATDLLQLINDVLDFSKLDSGNMRIEQTDFSLHKLIDDMKQLFERQFSDKQIAFVLEGEQALPDKCTGDPLRLRQILMNLLGNALKFTPIGGGVMLVMIASDLTDTSYTLECVVCDSGIGIPSNNLQSILEPFQQVDLSTTRKFGGTGLGLSICKQLVEAMGGSIDINSFENIGSRFRVRIPLRRQSPAAIERSLQADAQLKSTPVVQPLPIVPLRILIAEDNPVNQKLLMTILKHTGHQVCLAENGVQAVERFMQEQFDIILMDCQMPLMDGYKASLAIRAFEKSNGNTHIPIIAVTANALEGDREKCLEAGMDELVSKPIKRQWLETCMRDLVK